PGASLAGNDSSEASSTLSIGLLVLALLIRSSDVVPRAGGGPAPATRSCKTGARRGGRAARRAAVEGPRQRNEPKRGSTRTGGAAVGAHAVPDAVTGFPTPGGGPCGSERFWHAC